MTKKGNRKRTPGSEPARPRSVGRSNTRPAGKLSRSQRIAAAQQRKRRQRLVRRALAVGVVALIVATFTIITSRNRQAAARTVERLEAGTCRFDRSADRDAGQGRNHAGQAPAYRVDPPAGGNHVAGAARTTVYAGTVAEGEVVHAMEHGDIVLWHRPDVTPEVSGQLRQIADRYNDDVLVVSRPSLPTPIAATAWHRRLLCPTLEQGALELFVRSYRDKGPETVPEEE